MTWRTGKNSKQVCVRVNETLYDLIKEDVKKHGRTPAQSVRFILWQQLGNDNGQKLV